MHFDVGPWECFGEHVLNKLEELIAKKEKTGEEEQFTNGLQHRCSCFIFYVNNTDFLPQVLPHQ